MTKSQKHQNPQFQAPVCPVPLRHAERIVMGHGAGGSLTHELIEKVFLPHFYDPALISGNDFARLPGLSGEIITSIDCHIVKPLFFPGGDIGRLAICGTVNDVAVSGGTPLFITAGFIIEEGFSVIDLQTIVISMKEAAKEADVIIVAGDTKVVEKGSGDGLFITTTGIGNRPSAINIGGEFAKPGDAVLISGTIGDHGMAVISARGDLGMETFIKSDVAPLNHMIENLSKICPHIHVLRDPTRGGLATTLNEICRQSKVGILIEENSIPINPPVRSICEVLGFDPLYVANEGKVIVILPEAEVDAALDCLINEKYGKLATRIGSVTSENPGKVLLKTIVGGTRILDMLSGEMLPRIC